jgi:hypothetical protein
MSFPLLLTLNEFLPQVLAALADNAKHNQQGRVDEHGTLRHRLVELCPVGAIVRLFFAFFHVMKRPAPSFVPSFTTGGYGEYGYREWYDYHVFASKEDVKSEMTYDSALGLFLCVSGACLTSDSDHLKRVTIMHKENNVEITKSTHAGRYYSAMNSRAHGATVAGTKALGGWNESGSFRNCYDRAFPVDALLGAASFNAHKPEEYFLARAELGEFYSLQETHVF